jgi:hypothetical protein
MHLQNYSLGMGALGLPGDFSSASRFVRAFFVKENSVANKNEKDSVNQFFHILNSVAMPKGCVWTKKGFEYTRYSSCCNMVKASISPHIKIGDLFFCNQALTNSNQLRQQSFICFPVAYEKTAFHTLFLLFW